MYFTRNVVLGMLVGVMPVVAAISLPLRYETDFSQDPLWTTNNPERYYLDTSDGTYFIIQENEPIPGGSYSLYDAGYDGRSFLLRFDICMLWNNYASDVQVGLYNPTLEGNPGCAVYIIFTREDRGLTILLNWYNAAGNQGGVEFTEPDFVHNTWYRVAIEYDHETGLLGATVTVRDTGSVFATLGPVSTGPFSADMGLVGSSHVETTGAWQVLGAQSAGKIDNVAYYNGDTYSLSEAPQGFVSVCATTSSYWSAFEWGNRIVGIDTVRFSAAEIGSAVEAIVQDIDFFTPCIQEDGKAIEVGVILFANGELLALPPGENQEIARITLCGEVSAGTEIRFVDDVGDRGSPITMAAASGESITTSGTPLVLSPGLRASFKRGDTNDDKRFDIADPVVVLAYLFAQGSLLCPDAADANDSGALDIADPIYMLAWQFAGGPDLPPPWLAFGPDPTGDDLDACQVSHCNE
ncbi:MAG TPA: hypothetical protein DCM87_04020 [Planctomycetes bacterium]|nr:hypothetical protein [Planctomycetota bacterium]